MVKRSVGRYFDVMDDTGGTMVVFRSIVDICDCCAIKFKIENRQYQVQDYLHPGLLFFRFRQSVVDLSIPL